jgi:threonine/homoserine/homoserine lactone efflux protein
MESMMNTSSSEGSERKKTKRWAWITTIAYLILFPFLLMLAFASVMVFDRPNTPIAFGLGLIFMYFLMPLSIPCTLYLVWSRYAQGDYKQSQRYYWIPVYVIGAVLISFALMDAIEGFF